MLGRRARARKKGNSFTAKQPQKIKKTRQEKKSKQNHSLSLDQVASISIPES